MVAASLGGAGIAPHASVAQRPSAHASSDAAAVISGLDRDHTTKSPMRPDTRPSSLATTAVSTPERPRRYLPPDTELQGGHSGAVRFPVMLAKLAVFTDVLLSGLVIPLIPSILESRTEVPQQQVQIWIAVLVSAYGGGFAVASPLMPFFAQQDPMLYAVLLSSLAGVAGAFVLLQLSTNLHVLIFARALHGFSAAATTGACSAMLATAGSARGRIRSITGISPAFIQNAAMAAGPAIAGFLHEYIGTDAVFYCAYALIVLTALTSLIAANSASIRQADMAATPDGRARNYGTLSSGERSRSPSRSISPRTRLPARSSQRTTGSATPIPWSFRLLVDFSGYLAVGLLASALQSVLPLFAARRYNWSVSAIGFMFVPLFAPATFVGLVSGALAIRVPRSARFSAAVGLAACVPALVYLGQLTQSTELVRHAFLLTLGGISLGMGLSGEPLVQEMVDVVGFVGSDSWDTAAQATSLPNVAYAWGTLVGPLFSGATSWLWGWKTMTSSLAIVAAFTSVLVLLFMQGWLGSPDTDIRNPRDESSSDEESAPLLANDRSIGISYGYAGEPGSRKTAEFYTPGDDSDDTSLAAHNGGGGKHRTHRRHFSVDNFSIATTAASDSADSVTSQVRFQAALETPVPGSGRRPRSSDTSGRPTSERRYVMREAPHAPATDPLLAAGSLYVIDEERDAGGKGPGVGTEKRKRRVVVFAEGTAPPEVLERHRHHVVAINALDGTARMVSNPTENHAVHVTEETGEDVPGFSEATSRRYVVVVVEEDGDYESR